MSHNARWQLTLVDRWTLRGLCPENLVEMGLWNLRDSHSHHWDSTVISSFPQQTKGNQTTEVPRHIPAPQSPREHQKTRSHRSYLVCSWALPCTCTYHASGKDSEHMESRPYHRYDSCWLCQLDCICRVGDHVGPLAYDVHEAVQESHRNLRHSRYV